MTGDCGAPSGRDVPPLARLEGTAGRCKVIETPDYLADAKVTGLTDEERERSSRCSPETRWLGPKSPAQGGARKLRVAGRGKGKSGGCRVITFYSGTDVPVFLLAVQAERNALRVELAGLAEDYRRGVRRHVEGR